MNARRRDRPTWRSVAVAPLLAFGLGGCALLPLPGAPTDDPVATGEPEPDPPVAQGTGEAAVAASSGPGRAPAARRPARRPGPLPSGAIDLAGHCNQSEVDGFREQARLDVRGGAVQALDWQIWVGKRGYCRFDLSEFQQTRSRPHIELSARDRSGCKLLVYRDPRRVTLAHAGCAKRCTNGVEEEAWPVMFDPRTGRCANLNR